MGREEKRSTEAASLQKNAAARVTAVHVVKLARAVHHSLFDDEITAKVFQ
jgi:hypothetical protein